MPRLTNARMEMFCACLANGWTQQAAAAEAGYTGDPGVISRLAKNDKVRIRIAEMRANMAASALVSVELATQELLDIARSALSVEPGPAYVPALNCAKGCWDTIARINGLINDKATLTLNLRAEDMTDAQLLAIAARGLPDISEKESDTIEPN